MNLFSETENPFPITGYEKAEYFCDREKETKTIISATEENKRNLTLFSNRRVKTALIQHVFHQLNTRKNTSVIYFDILGTANLQEFVSEFAAAVIGKLDSGTSRFLKKATDLITALRPKISYDALTGEPEVTVDIKNEKEAVHTLDEIFKYLKEHAKKAKIIIAIDEFQQVLEYPGKNAEALLRSKIQLLPNVSFIFSGSRKHMLMEMFMSAKRPFYQSTDLLELKVIDPQVYTAFIQKLFKKGKKTIAPADIMYIIDWTRDITFYVQSVCNRLFYLPVQELTREIINQTLYDLMKERESGFYNYRTLLATQQWNLLIAIAKEGIVTEPTSAQFMQRYKLGANSTVRTALKALLEKELVVYDQGEYFIYDVFFPGGWKDYRILNNEHGITNNKG